MMSASAFTEPARIVEPLNWVGHVPFAIWLTEILKPGVIAELGTHTGNSYFAFCQSVRDHALPTRCYAVDTWQGDEHAGYYGDRIYNTVAAYNDEHYRSFSRLLRMTFDEALSRFSDGSIDLLHIDGLHTYEAVRHDFDSWLPKMSDRGVILFHDTTVRHADFGVWKLWEEVSKKYPHIAFDQSHGLGVLFTGMNIDPALAAVLRDVEMKTGHAHIKTLFTDLGEQLLEQSQIKFEQNHEKSFCERRDDISNIKIWRNGSTMLKPIRKLRKSIKKRYGKLKKAFRSLDGNG